MKKTLWRWWICKIPEWILSDPVALHGRDLVFWTKKNVEILSNRLENCPLISDTTYLYNMFFFLNHYFDLLSTLNLRNPAEMSCIQHISTIPAERHPPTTTTHTHFLHTCCCWWRGAINHLHSAPPVSLCRADQLDQSALQNKKKQNKPLMNKLANEMARCNVDLWGCLSL